MKYYVAILLFSFANLFCDEAAFLPSEMRPKLIEKYNMEERKEIEKDLLIIRSVCFEPANEKVLEKLAPCYIATAGGSGARKSTILAKFLKSHPELSQIVHLDADHRGLKFMLHTYYSFSLSPLAVAGEDYSFVQKCAYEKWRPASNYITYSLLEEAFSRRYSVAHATGSAGAHVPHLFQRLKKEGYEITLLLCSCTDEFRKKSIEHRTEGQLFYQSSPEVASIQAKFFPICMPVYFSHADILYLYWSDEISKPEYLAAILQKGKVKILDANALTLFQKRYEEERKALKNEGHELPCWEELLSRYQARF